jgi:elongation factor P
MAVKKGTDLRRGDILRHQNGVYKIMECTHLTPGNKRGMIITKLQSIETGKNSEYRFRSDETAEILFLDRRMYQYLYDEAENYIFMNPETFEQVPVSKEFIGETGKFLQPEMMVQLDFMESRPIGVHLPDKVEIQVDTTEPNIKGATATTSFKPAILTNGVRVMVPPFVESGEWIRVDTDSLEYTDRVKK